MYIFILWIFYGMSGAALIVLRRRWPDAERPYRVWGYPFVPIAFVLVTVYLLINTLVSMPTRALAGIVLIIVGMPVYEYFMRRAGDVTPPMWRQEGSQED
jgi:APA family basic amino acid/polyamine antiporter